MAWEVLTISSMSRAPGSKSSMGSRREQMSARAATSSGRATLGNVMQKCGGSLPRDFAASSVRNMSGVRIIFVVGAIAIAILEIEPEIFDRLAAQLFPNASLNRVCEPSIGIFASRNQRIGFDGSRKRRDRIGGRRQTGGTCEAD